MEDEGMGISTVPTLTELGKQREAEQVEAEAWRIAQLAATIMGTTWFYESVGAKGAVEQARAILAESRRQAAASAGERHDG